MATNTLHGITSLTPQELLIDAGVVVRNFDPTAAAAAWDVLGATDGGIKVDIKPEIHGPTLDGAYAPVKGTERITKWDVAVSATLKAIGVEALMDVLIGAGKIDLAAHTTTHWDINPGLLSAADYRTNIAVLVTASVNPVLPYGAVFILLNARTDGVMALQTKHADEVAFPFNYIGVVTPADPQTAPYRILYPKVVGEAS